MLENTENDKVFISHKNEACEITISKKRNNPKNSVRIRTQINLGDKISLNLLNNNSAVKPEIGMSIQNKKVISDVVKDADKIQNTIVETFLPRSPSLSLLEKTTNFHLEAKKIIVSILENNYYIIYMCLVTFYALFANDFDILLFDPKHDYIFNLLSTVTFGIFSLEVILSCYARDNYVFTFFFWLDVISTLSLLMEIPLIFTPILNVIIG